MRLLNQGCWRWDWNGFLEPYSTLALYFSLLQYCLLLCPRGPAYVLQDMARTHSVEDHRGRGHFFAHSRRVQFYFPGNKLKRHHSIPLFREEWEQWQVTKPHGVWGGGILGPPQLWRAWQLFLTSSLQQAVVAWALNSRVGFESWFGHLLEPGMLDETRFLEGF